MVDKNTTEYSVRLGYIKNEQFQKALDKHDLGRLQLVTPVSRGLFGQNVFLTTDKGEFVFRGAPHYPWQFETEKYFVDKLHGSTKVPVPYPYMVDDDSSIFGWEYVIMSRMKGKNLSDDLDEKGLNDTDRLSIARVQGEMLQEAQKLTHTSCGKYDLETKRVKPFEPSYVDAYYTQILERLEKAAKHNDKTPREDIVWVKKTLEQSRSAMKADFTPTFVMQDYKPGNMNVEIIDGKWRITGLFDFMEASFGNGEADVSRMFCVYIEKNHSELAYAFLRSFLQGHDHEDFAQRFPVFMFHDRSIIWEWVQRANKVWWDKDLTFRQWIEPYLKLDEGMIRR